MGGEAVIVLYGDRPFLSPESIRRLADRHAEGDNTITMMVVHVPHFNDWYNAFERWGRILRDQTTGHIIGNVEYKDASERQRAITEVNPSFYCFDTKWLWENIGKLTNRNAAGEYYLTDLIAMAVEQGRRISSLPVKPEEAIGVNTPQEHAFAEEVRKRQL